MEKMHLKAENTGSDLIKVELTIQNVQNNVKVLNTFYFILCCCPHLEQAIDSVPPQEVTKNKHLTAANNKYFLCDIFQQNLPSQLWWD